ncbi:TetR/AcrR family transcriptional regulator [Nonomuraea dietziae]|uniref:TetR/AcrR family transcriptional regulator n=1 Tax=Nonomuraea dietziae TaxID=65515 RepID=UPI0031E43C06
MRRSSEDTKSAILAAARERFGADGYEKATIRAIAGDVGVDPAMVMRYFGNKEKLFAAAAHFDLRFPDLASTPREQVGTAMVGHFLDLWETSEALQVLLRTGVTNEAAAERMREIFATQLGPLAARLCPDPATAPTRAGPGRLADPRPGAHPLRPAPATRHGHDARGGRRLARSDPPALSHRMTEGSRVRHECPLSRTSARPPSSNRA